MKDNLDRFQKLVSTRWTFSISITIGFDCRDPQGYENCLLCLIKQLKLLSKIVENCFLVSSIIIFSLLQRARARGCDGSRCVVFRSKSFLFGIVERSKVLHDERSKVLHDERSKILGDVERSEILQPRSGVVPIEPPRPLRLRRRQRSRGTRRYRRRLRFRGRFRWILKT